MILNEKEKGIIDVFYASILKYQNEIFEFIYDDRKIICSFDTAYESDNCLDEDNQNYEEYFALIFRNIKDNFSHPTLHCAYVSRMQHYIYIQHELIRNGIGNFRSIPFSFFNQYFSALLQLIKQKLKL